MYVSSVGLETGPDFHVSYSLRKLMTFCMHFHQVPMKRCLRNVLKNVTLITSGYFFCLDETNVTAGQPIRIFSTFQPNSYR